MPKKKTKRSGCSYGILSSVVRFFLVVAVVFPTITRLVASAWTATPTALLLPFRCYPDETRRRRGISRTRTARKETAIFVVDHNNNNNNHEGDNSPRYNNDNDHNDDGNNHCNDNSNAVDRRRFFVAAAGGSVSSSVVPFLLLGKDNNANAAARAKGAAELDFDFYVRDLLGGNKKEGTVAASVPPPMPPPRTLGAPLLSYMLDNDCTVSCAPIQALTAILSEKQKQNNSGQPPIEEAQQIREKIQSLRTRSGRSFSVRAPWREEKVSDQYYFDLTAYALWRTAAELLPDYLDRDVFARDVGRLLYEKMKSEGLLQQLPSSTATEKNNGSLLSLRQSEPTVTRILDLFVQSRFIEGYKLVNPDSQQTISSSSSDSPLNNNNKLLLFDEIDEEALEGGGTVNCLVSVYEPATMGASLQITGERSRFVPDFVAPTLSAAWEKENAIRSSWETFFVDAEYRPNPKDYYPNEKLFQFALKKKA